MKKIVRFFIMAVCCWISLYSTISYAKTTESILKDEPTRRVVRVGSYGFNGYHIRNENGIYSGYGYDIFQLLLNYGNWKFEFVGYDKSWNEMLHMLEDGEIDILTQAVKTPEREKLFSFSKRNIGTGHLILTTKDDDNGIEIENYKSYDGKRIGFVTGTFHEDSFKEFAKEHNFTYTPVYYSTTDLLVNSLLNSNQIDMAVTNNQRVFHNERLLDKFKYYNYFAIVKKGNEELLKSIDRGLNQLDTNTPGWREQLFSKYYLQAKRDEIFLSKSELEYVNKLNKANVSITFAMNPELAPYSYFEDGKPRGTIPQYIREICSKVNLKCKIISANNRWDYKRILKLDSTDGDLTAFSDYGVSQKYDIKETYPYLHTSMALISRTHENINKPNMKIAVLRDPTEYSGLNSVLFKDKQIVEFDSIPECIDAVKTGKVDGTYRYSYVAEKAVTEDQTGILQYMILPEYSFGLSIGLKDNLDHRLLSILNKSITALPSTLNQKFMLLERGLYAKRNFTLKEYFYQNPFEVTIVSGFVVIFILVIIALAVITYFQKNRLLAMQDLNRFRSYVCDSFDMVSEINLFTQKRTDFKMKNGNLIVDVSPYQDFSIEFYKKIFHPDDYQKMYDTFNAASVRNFNATNVNNEPVYLEARRLDETGKYVWYAYTLKTIKIDTMHPRSFMFFKKNIEAVKEKDESQRAALLDALNNAKSASTAKGQFLSRISHEIRTPLNAVIGYMDIAHDSSNDLDKVMHCVDNTAIAAKHLLSIINDVLDISSIESGRMKIAHEKMSLAQSISQLSTLFFNQAKAKNVRFDTLIQGLTEEIIYGDKLRLNQILINLINNAIKFTPENGKVTLTINQEKLDDKHVFLKFTVADTGIGMSEEYLHRIFKPFEQESATTAQKYGGTGLGLSICYNLVKMKGGSIDVESKQNQGTKFTVSLHFDRVTSDFNLTSNEIARFSSIRFAVINSDSEYCSNMKALLKKNKIKCDCFTDIDNAVKRIKIRQETDYKYGICFVDLDMKESAIELIQSINSENLASKPIMVACSYDSSNFGKDLEDLQVKHFISKPIFRSSLFNLLKENFGDKNTEEVTTEHEEDNSMFVGMRLLLAEDIPMNREIATELLRKKGFVVDVAEDGVQAVDKFKNSEIDSYKAILMDIQMPNMNGFEATRAIRKLAREDSSLPIIALTANAFAEDVNEALANGMNAHISKPINFDDLCKTLKNVMRNKQ